MKKTQDSNAYWRGWLLLFVGFLLPLSTMADEVKVADSNGNELRYSYDADGPATFIGISKYSTDADKAGHIIIADQVTDDSGNSHDVLYIGGSLSNRNNIVSVVFGQNIIATGGADGTKDDAFYNCSNLESVTLNSKLQILGKGTFRNCRNLTSINVSELTSLTTIMYKAFDNVDLLRQITIPHSVTTIGESAFNSIDSLRTVTFATGSKLTSMGSNAFSYNSKLESINIEACTLLTALPNSWLYSCPCITSLTIPASVTEFGSWMFYNTDNIETITFYAPSVPNSFYSGRKKLATINLGPGVKSIGENAFSSNSGLKTVNFAPAISELNIMRSAFNNCDGMKSITLPAGLTTLGNGAIASCDSLETIIFPKGCQLTTMGSEVFSYNKSLVSINIEECTLLTALPNSWLYSCPCVKSLTIPASVTEFGSWMFYYTDNIETITFLAPSVPNGFYNSRSKLTTINIGPGVKSIGESAFSSQKGLKTVNFDEGVSDLTIMRSAFNNCDGLRTFTLPAGVSTLGNDVFNNCDSLATFTFAAGSTLKVIPNSAFSYCKSLETITLPDAVETVEGSAFYDCESLTEVNFGTGITTLSDSWVFSYAPVKKIVLPGPQNPFTGTTGLSESLVTLYVHPDLVEEYRNHDVTKCFHIMAIGQPTDFVVTTTEGGQLQAKVEAVGAPNNLLTLTVTGPLNGTDIDYIHSSMPNVEVLNLTNASIVEGGDSYHQWDVNSGGIATIETYHGPWNTEKDVITRCMFYNMPRLRSISLPKDVKKIGEYALAQDRKPTFSLAHVDIPAGVTEIANYAFYYSGIEEVTVPAGVTRLEPYVFHHCEKLKKAVLPDGITFIGNSAFRECYALEDVNIPAQVETIEQYAFNNNKVRTTPIVFPATLKSVGYQAFGYNSKVENITFNEGLQTISSYAFSNCNAVKAIVLPESITTLENNAFEGCDSLTEFRFPKAITEVSNGILYHCDKLQKVVLAEGTTRLGYAAFSYCPQLNDINVSAMNTLTFVDNYVFENTGFTTMTLPNSITEVGYCTFQSCKQLESVNVPTGIDYVPENYCKSNPLLRTVKMHDGIRVIRNEAFEGCASLTDIELNDKITRIEYDAFWGTNVAFTKLPDSLTFIGGSSFRDTKAMTCALTIPSGVTTIDGDAFNGSGLTSVTLPKGIKTWGSGLFANCKSLTSVQLPSDIKRITNYMFQSCSALEQIQLPDSLKEIGYAAFDWSGLTSVTLPDSLEVLESSAFSNTQISSIRIPDGIRRLDQPGSYLAAGCKLLKEAYLGRNQDYTTITSFTYFSGCDSLELLRVYAGMPPKCDGWYMGYRKNCVLEVPEDAVEFYKEADVWKEFKEIRGFFQGDLLNDLDFAILKKLYRELDGQNWKQPWDLSNNHRSMGKWFGVVTVGDYITEINLSGQGVKGELPDSLFLLPRIEVLNLSDNHIKADLTTLLANRSENTTLTVVNMMGNELTGDIYPFAVKLPNLKKLDLSYNQLTAVSQPISREKLENSNFARGFQFVDYQSKQVVEGAPVIDITPGIPATIENNTLQTYRHEYGDYKFDFSDLYRHYVNKNGSWTTSDYELVKNSEGLWNLYTNWYNRPLRAPKGVPVIYTHGNPWWSHLTYIMRFDWKDGDANADQTVDVTDLQSIIYYALNDSKAEGQMFNFTTADANADDVINVSDVVGSVDYILSYVETEPVQVPYYYNRAPASQQNVLSIDGNNVVLTHPDAVAALQLTITGAALGQLHVSEALKSRFSVAMREVAGGVRLVVYSAEGHALTPGIHQLLTDLPAGAVVTDVRLSDALARHLDVVNEVGLTGISTLSSVQPVTNDVPVFDFSGRRLGAWDTLPEGIYVIRINGKQYKVKK
ncbi:MAG: leucine-rich repeat protein [Prevotella sp.]|nr:leucine-rich repeat protein [Prevotella sp.]